MKIQRSDIGRFLQFARKIWKSMHEGDFQIVVFTVTQRSCSIEMARDGLLLTYLCNLVDTETGWQVIAVPFELLKDCSDGTGTLDLQSIVDSGERLITAKWSDGLVWCERTYPAQAPQKFHLMPDLAWHTVDERMARMLQSSAGEKSATSHRVNSFPIEPIATVPG